MHLGVILAIAFLAVVFGPRLWIKWVLRRHAADRPDYPGTGGEFARHLLDELGLQEVKVEPSPVGVGDHYDSGNKAVRLIESNFSGRSLTAVAIAAHEVGHAIQDRDGYMPLQARTRLVQSTQIAQKMGAIFAYSAPVVALLVRSPVAGLVGVLAAVLSMGISVIVHLVTLPVEFDASFKKALPVLENGGYLPPEDMAGARQILTAAALTYVAASLISLLNFWRWIKYLR